MKLLHKYFIYSCEENPNKIKILLKKCKHILSNNKNLSINNNNKTIENDNKNITFFIYIVNVHIPSSTKNCYLHKQLYVGTWKWKIAKKIIMIMIKKKIDNYKWISELLQKEIIVLMVY